MACFGGRGVIGVVPLQWVPAVSQLTNPIKNKSASPYLCIKKRITVGNCGQVPWDFRGCCPSLRPSLVSQQEERPQLHSASLYIFLTSPSHCNRPSGTMMPSLGSPRPADFSQLPARPFNLKLLLCRKPRPTCSCLSLSYELALFRAQDLLLFQKSSHSPSYVPHDSSVLVTLAKWSLAGF